jgi:transcriptional regulator with XRE-family HTH domain
LVNAAQRNFGRRLRDQRERAQIALSEIAEATKIKRSLLEELERGDVSAWPAGIFRRAFVRAYASAIGLSPESVVEEFTQVFPDGAPRGGAEAKHELRLTLVVDPWRRAMTAVTNVVVALVEAGAIVALALLTSWMAAASVWSVCAAMALTYYAVSAACLGRSPGSWCLEHGLPTRRPRRSTASSASARARDLIHLVQRREAPEEQIPEDGAASATPLRAASH